LQEIATHPIPNQQNWLLCSTTVLSSGNVFLKFKNFQSCMKKF